MTFWSHRTELWLLLWGHFWLGLAERVRSRNMKVLWRGGRQEQDCLDGSKIPTSNSAVSTCYVTSHPACFLKPRFLHTCTRHILYPGSYDLNFAHSSAHSPSQSRPFIHASLLPLVSPISA